MFYNVILFQVYTKKSDDMRLKNSKNCLHFWKFNFPFWGESKLFVEDYKSTYNLSKLLCLLLSHIIEASQSLKQSIQFIQSGKKEMFVYNFFLKTSNIYSRVVGKITCVEQTGSLKSTSFFWSSSFSLSDGNRTTLWLTSSDIRISKKNKKTEHFPPFFGGGVCLYVVCGLNTRQHGMYMWEDIPYMHDDLSGAFNEWRRNNLIFFVGMTGGGEGGVWLAENGGETHTHQTLVASAASSPTTNEAFLLGEEGGGGEEEGFLFASKAFPSWKMEIKDLYWKDWIELFIASVARSVLSSWEELKGKSWEIAVCLSYVN